MTQTIARFAAPELLNLGKPPDLASREFEALFQQSLTDLLGRLDAAEIPYDVQGLETDPAVILTQAAAYRDMLRRREIDDAVAQTFLGSATGAMLDARAADYGVLRRSLPHTLPSNQPAPNNRPASVPPAWAWDADAALWREDDRSLRQRARLAWEALSVAGPPGAYVFHALDAHPGVVHAAVYGPESEIVSPGEVLVVVQSATGSGVPSQGILDAVAARLDAYQVTNAFGATQVRSVRDPQSVRPLGAKVLIEAAQVTTFHVDATLEIYAGPDPEALRQTALARLAKFFDQNRLIGRKISREAIIAVLGVADERGLPVIVDVDVRAPENDIEPAYNQIAMAGAITVDVQVV